MEEREGEALERQLRQTLRKQPALRSLTEAHLVQIIDSIEVECYAAGDHIVEQNTGRSAGAALFVILDGEAKVAPCTYLMPKPFIDRRMRRHNNYTS